MSKQDEKIAKHINKLCLDKMDYNDFFKAIYDELENWPEPLEPKSESAINRWYNGKNVPDPEYYPIIAKVLNVSVNEIRAGEPLETDILQDEINKLVELKNATDKERKTVHQAIKWKKYNLQIVSLFLTMVGLFFLNITLWANPWVFVATLIGSFLVVLYNEKKLQENKVEGKKKKGIVNALRSFVSERIELIKFISKDNLISNAWALILLLFLIVCLIPLIEILFYGGKFYTTCVVYFGLSIILLIKSINRQ